MYPGISVEFEQTTQTETEVPGLGPPAAAPSSTESAIPQVLALGVEFVALPGEPDRLQREIPQLVRDANGKSESFRGCMVLFSEQEVRLVTVITLWSGRGRAGECNEKRLKRLLEPYVDRWLRIRSFVAFLSTS